MKGTSKTKFCKGTDIPKHSGNYSYYNSDAYKLHYQTQSYRVWKNEYGEIIVGNGRYLRDIISPELERLMLDDPNFQEYRQKGQFRYGAQLYDSDRTVIKNFLNDDWTLTETINTRGDFKYNFPEY